MRVGSQSSRGCVGANPLAAFWTKKIQSYQQNEVWGRGHERRSGRPESGGAPFDDLGGNDSARQRPGAILRERGVESERIGKLSDATLADLEATGVFGALRPTAAGGNDAEAQDLFVPSHMAASLGDLRGSVTNDAKNPSPLQAST